LKLEPNASWEFDRSGGLVASAETKNRGATSRDQQFTSWILSLTAFAALPTLSHLSRCQGDALG